LCPLQLTFDTAQDYSMIDFPGRFEYRAQQRVAVAFDWASHSRLMAYGFVPCIQVRLLQSRFVLHSRFVPCVCSCDCCTAVTCRGHVGCRPVIEEAGRQADRQGILTLVHNIVHRTLLHAIPCMQQATLGMQDFD
jgi:hypothetical protein